MTECKFSANISYASNSSIKFSKEAQDHALANNFELKGYVFEGKPEELRPRAVTRVGIIQNAIVRPTSDPLAVQRDALFERIKTIINGAALCGVNVICLQEAWSMFVLEYLIV